MDVMQQRLVKLISVIYLFQTNKLTNTHILKQVLSFMCLAAHCIDFNMFTSNHQTLH